MNCAQREKRKRRRNWRMKITWKKQSKGNNRKRSLAALSNLPFEDEEAEQPTSTMEAKVEEEGEFRGLKTLDSSDGPSAQQLADSFQAQGDKLAEGGKYREALGKWETALTLMPGKAVLHEQKAQVLLEIGDAWNALKAATRATELEPSWAEAWITLGRAQLNFGEPDIAIKSFDRALAIKPNSEEAQDDRKSAFHLVKRRKQLHSSGLSDTENRFVVGDKTESS
ncbi:tetratricopeptide repeat protein 33 isoform X2 [Vitis riparia]|uniref:tetratricopeptide repeat protein 33 isoform X2 n=1 Tax=Vitis riparia TaxID=96939 RepID=UPI00155A2426|nr:tetratricopeptide repeat protein 33 isoform X2 [Vitis riparia]